MIQWFMPETSAGKQKKVTYSVANTANADFAPSFHASFLPALQLQRILGNQSLTKLIRAKRLTPEGKIIGLQHKHPFTADGNKYEPDANRPFQSEIAPVEAMTEENDLLQTRSILDGSLQNEVIPNHGATVQRQDEENGISDTDIPVTVPNVSGTAELTSLDGSNPYFDQAFGKWKYQADALTTADFLPPVFTTTNETAKRAKGCDGCGAADCFKVSATAVITFDVNINVNLPSGSDFADLKECEQKQVQTLIDTVLKPHEQKHVAAYKTYRGKIFKPVSTLACRDDVESGAALTAATEAIANAEGSKRSVGARAASDKLDPFVINADLKNCKDKQAFVPSDEQSEASDEAYV